MKLNHWEIIGFVLLAETWLEKKGNEITSETIDSWIFAEIPDSSIDPLGYTLITQKCPHQGSFSAGCGNAAHHDLFTDRYAPATQSTAT
jgi:hypothetical protein